MQGGALQIGSGLIAAAGSGAPAGGGGSLLGGAFLSAGVAVICFFLLLRLRRKTGGRRRRGPGARERVEDLRTARRPEGAESLEQLMVDVQELTRECAAQIDTRAARLESLLREADQLVARLEAARDGEPAKGPSNEPIRQAHMPRVEVAEPKKLDPLTRQVYELADRGLPSVEIAQELDEQIGKVDLILALRPR